MLDAMVPQWIIEKKRDGGALSGAEIRETVEAYTRGDLPDYQMAALAMAIFFKGMTFEEVTALTDAMLHSGEIIDTSAIALPKADKHSTGGIGDKVSLVLAPLVAACDVAVPMLSGRGLGITGGTLDKLESIPGYRTDLTTREFLKVLGACGCVITGQTPDLAPADRKLYALRDVTGTVPSIPLISASIMSKKLAEGTDALVLDVKWGQGAFMRTEAQARELARTMVEIGARMGKGMAAVLTDMNQPLGRTAGNALEVVETLEALAGRGPQDLMEVTLELGAHMLTLTGAAPDHAAALTRLRERLASGAAWERWLKMVELQGGDPRALEHPERLPQAAITAPFDAPRDGTVTTVDAERIGRAVLVLGAGRVRVEDRVDPAVGISGLVKIGEQVTRGQPLLTLHANRDDRLAEARALLDQAIAIADGPASPRPLIGERIYPHDSATA